MSGRHHSKFTMFLAVLLGGTLLVLPTLDVGGPFLPLALAPCFLGEVPAPLVATGYVASEPSSIWLEPQAANAASRALPTFSIS